ncbi:hypothetical protein H4R20_000847 [Coemansia guatemalensis]|uniref:Uncharacterized protein n=1 Tax=Coemansia guatemalensis TaxID=2761395 RepID=A0A9W8I5H4_9FUNG|nr:hypothetical protein H4R20_000847 [Coemansia guatemalensis]
MQPRLVQVLKLPVLSLSLVNSPSSANERALLAPGLNLAFPACPLCAHKAVPQLELRAVGTASTNHRQPPVSWSCRHCHAAIQNKDIRWTYRIIVSATTCAFEAREINISALGTATEGYFGCTAAQWVEETDKWLRVLEQRWTCGDGSALVEHMAERLAAVVGLAAGTSGLCAFIELRQTPFTGANRSRRTTQLSAARIRPVSGIGSAPLKILALWRFVVYEALSAARAGGSSQLFCVDSDTEQLLVMLETDARSLRIAEELGAPFSAAEFSAGTIDHDPAATAEGVTQTIDGDNVLAIWECVSTRLGESLATHKLGIPSPIEDVDGSLMTTEADEINHLLENSSQLFVFSPETTELIDKVDPLSMQLFEESLRDEHLHSMFLDSQQLLDVTESQLSQYSGSVGFDSSRALWSAPGVYQTPAESPTRTSAGSFMRSLEDTPFARSLGSGSEIASTSRPNIPRSLLSFSSDTPLAPDLQRGSSSEDKRLLVLADETPMASSSGSKRKLNLFVPETPLPTRGSIQQLLPDTPTHGRITNTTPGLRRSASADRTWAIPETPAVGSKHPLDNPAFNPCVSGAAPIRRLHEYRPLAMVDDYKADKAQPPRKRGRSGSLAISRPLAVRKASETSDPRINPLCLYTSNGNRGNHDTEDKSKSNN